MFRRKSEKRAWPAVVILGIGALAAIGAVSISKKGTQLFDMMKNKVRGMFKKCSCEDIVCDDACDID